MTPDAPERIRQIEEVLEDEPIDLATGSSVESIRGSTGSDMSRLPFLTVNDIVVLRDAGLHDIEDIEEGIFEVPDSAWEHVLFMIRARVVQVDPSNLRKGIEEEA